MRIRKIPANVLYAICTSFVKIVLHTRSIKIVARVENTGISWRVLTLWYGCTKTEQKPVELIIFHNAIIILWIGENRNFNSFLIFKQFNIYRLKHENLGR